MAATQQGPDPIESMESLNTLTIETNEESVSAKNSKEQPLSTKDEKTSSTNASSDTSILDPSRDAQFGSLDTDRNCSAVYPPNIYAPQAQTFYYGGYENTSGEWEEYPQYMNIEGMEVGSTGIYNENPALVFHAGYGYNPQMPYGPYSPVTTPLPSVSGDGQLYSPQQFPFSGPYYQQQAPPSMPYLPSPTPVSQQDLGLPIDQQGAFLADTSNSNGMLFGPRPDYHLPYGSFGRGSFAGNSGNPGFYDLRQGFDGFGSGGFLSDWLKSSDGTRSLTPMSSPVASPQPIGTLGSFVQGMAPLASGMPSQQQRSLYGFGSSISSFDRGYSHGGMYQQDSNFGGFIPSLGMSGQGLLALDKGRRRGKGNASLCSCNGTLDFLNEQNRGPRATRPKNPTTEQNSSLDSKRDSPAMVDRELYNRPDFVTEYKDAKFFIIKSYSEDNVHKSIKYGVWASTANGNRKLDSAYHEAKEKEDLCPVFLFFSVNASAQFCGVAEMIGPVDFEKSVDYWQQDKWTGQFPVKWHIIKDVPNNLFRHIILQNNDNKPVTNSRDTQEVKLEQGQEMLKLFKNHESDVSILDDFDFYEERQKAMQERKAKQQQQQFNATVLVPVAMGGDARHTAPISGGIINQISKTFAEAVRLDENKTGNEPVRSDTAVAEPEDLKNSAFTTVTSSS